MTDQAVRYENATIRYSLSADDYWAIGRFTARCRFDSPAFIVLSYLKIVVATLAMLALLIYGALDLFRHPGDWELSGVQVAIPLLVAAYFGYSYHVWRHPLRYDPDAFAERQAEITNTGVVLTRGTDVLEFVWAEIDDVANEPARLLVTSTTNLTFCIPKTTDDVRLFTADFLTRFASTRMKPTSKSWG